MDEYRLVVSSIVTGPGERLFNAGDPKRVLKLVDSTATPAGSLLLTYRTTDHNQ